MSDRDSWKNNIDLLKARAAGEPVAAYLGMELLELEPGFARVRMEMRPHFVNFHGLTFGGIIMALADQAFGYASNSLAYPSVASQFNTYFISAAREGDILTAECRVIKSGRRTGFSEVSITNQDGKLVARATGTTIPLDPPASNPV
jgi:acyl-CoA thioesterase